MDFNCVKPFESTYIPTVPQRETRNAKKKLLYSHTTMSIFTNRKVINQKAKTASNNFRLTLLPYCLINKPAS